MAHEGRTTETACRSKAPRDSGTTFIEILVSIVLLGTAGIAVLVGVSAALRGSATHDRVATAQANLADAGDHLTDVTLGDDTYVSCASTTDYDAEVNPFGVTVASVEFWDGSGWGACLVGNELQRITLVTNIGGVDRELVVVKREASVATAPGGPWNDDIVTPVPHPDL